MAVKVVNMIPHSLSGETNRDSEPSVAVNPENPLQIAASAFTPDPAGSNSGPIFISSDGGDTWALNVVLPGGNRTVDITLRFATISEALYAGILRYDNANLNILRTADYSAATPMTVLFDRADRDQPYVEAATGLGGEGALKDHVYVGNNELRLNFTASDKTALSDQSMDAGLAAPPAGFTTLRLEPRVTVWQDGPSIRPAVHPNGTIYAAYFGWRQQTATGTFISDVVVARDDNWGASATPYSAILDGGDGLAGVRVVTGVSIPSFSPTTFLGTQRIGSSLSLAVDPTDHLRVYIAWADGTSGSNYTIHLRRSIDGGANWSGDLRTVASATNPSVAVNTHGNVGFLYQRLYNPGTGNRWQTHFEKSDDGLFAPFTDAVLADVPDQNGSYNGNNPIGDYTGLVAVGKNFYGVFSANNTPDLANFPSGVTYLREVDWNAHTLKDLANNPVAVSIDPYFFKSIGVEPENDFYVRDWTDSASSGDTGLEPSTNPVFYATSDVWNRRSSVSGAPFPNDQPVSLDAGSGLGAAGDNWAFARIRRNKAPGGTVPPVNVNAHFLVSKFGTGSNYVDSTSADPDVSFIDPDPTVSFMPTDTGPFVTTGCHWHLNPIASIHLCLAVEISAPGDPYVPPSLLGNTPGWPTTDLRIIHDNNKAQRNIGVSHTLCDGIDEADIYYAIVHNAATIPRDIEIAYQTGPEFVRRIKGARIEIIGGQAVGMETHGSLLLKNVQPGENRWIGLAFSHPRGKEGEMISINFYETLGGKVLNGFAIAAKLAKLDDVIRSRVELHRSICSRLSELKIPGAKESMSTAERLLVRGAGIGKEGYMHFLTSQLKFIESSVAELLRAEKTITIDHFGLYESVKAVRAGLGSKNVGRAIVAHSVLLNKLDAFITMLQLSKGDVADILQNVRWQNDLYLRKTLLARLPCAPKVREASTNFINAYGRRKIGNNEFPQLIKTLMDYYEETVEALEAREPRLKADLAAMEKNLTDLRGLQKSHREFLLKLQEV